MTPIAERRVADSPAFSGEIGARYEPLVMRGLVADWPAVKQAAQSPQALAGYLAGFDSGKPVDTLLAPASVKGRIFYSENMAGFNFTRNASTVSAVAEQLLRYAPFDNRPMLAVQSALIADCLPGFVAENRLAILDPSIAPRIWLGNRVVTPAHFDESSNVACVVSGRRRFTLFPPEQIANLYVGPLDYAPTGTPISMVDIRTPDLVRFPRFAEALAHAQVTELEPGDAIYIPALWWHHVESLDKFNMLVNYWWRGAPGTPGMGDSALDCLLHSLLTLRHLPAEQRKAWGAIFAHYVFDADPHSAGHIPAQRRGILGDMTPDFRRQVRAFLMKQLDAKK